MLFLQVDVYVNKVGPYANTYETYHYYSLPFCRPKRVRCLAFEGIKKGIGQLLQVVHKSLSLGQVLEGDRMAESAYNITVMKNVTKASLCGSYSLEQAEVTRLRSAVEEEFYFEFIIDDFRLRNFIGVVQEVETFPHKHLVFLYRHFLFNLHYNERTKQFQIICATLEKDSSSAVDLSAFDSSNFELLYSVVWIPTKLVFLFHYKFFHHIETSCGSNRDNDFFTPKSVQVQWISVINSALLVLLLIFFVSLILLSVVRHDLNRYNEASSDIDMIVLENGWKTVSMDVFRKPPRSNFFSAIIGYILIFFFTGVGTQFIFLISIILIVGSTDIPIGIAGFVSARTYRQLEGEKWIQNVVITTGLFNVPMFFVWAINNSVSWISGSTQALPYTTVILLGILWLFVGFPLTVVGAAIGKNVTSRYSAPCRTRNVPRELPLLPFYHSTICFSFLSGIVAFSSIAVELNYLFSTLWGRETYTLCHILFIILCLLMAVVAATSAALTYFQLNAEDYRWWWRSVFVGGAVGFFVFFYGAFFYEYRSGMSGLQQTIQYFSYLSMLCYVFFLSLGSVSFFASHRFVRFIYSSVKTD
ncbi:unnamed protein product [Enterobius vermicularis]|uniref:Transmembrane 9 superfamily member n=1 Tax=Enterobius vermicularis TaxID=51028 RepID=A0A0N4VAI7_ENTVE|nr:unnamed protein product [Enterobius vermicularis]